MRVCIVALLLTFPFIWIGCSEKTSEPNGNGHTDDAEYWTGVAWELYDEGDFKGARGALNRALDRDSTYVPAYAAMGWVTLERGWAGLALQEFETAIAMDSTLVDCYYGAAYMEHTQALTFPSRAGEYLLQSLDFAMKGLQRGGDSFTFVHNAGVNAYSLRILMARSYYGLGDYESAHEIVDLLDPDNGLDPLSPAYLRELLVAIEGLGGSLP